MAYLFNMSQTLELLGVDNLNGQRVKADTSMNGIVEEFQWDRHTTLAQVIVDQIL